MQHWHTWRLNFPRPLAAVPLFPWSSAVLGREAGEGRSRFRWRCFSSAQGRLLSPVVLGSGAPGGEKETLPASGRAAVQQVSSALLASGLTFFWGKFWSSFLRFMRSCCVTSMWRGENVSVSIPSYKLFVSRHRELSPPSSSLTRGPHCDSRTGSSAARPPRSRRSGRGGRRPCRPLRVAKGTAARRRPPWAAPGPAAAGPARGPSPLGWLTGAAVRRRRYRGAGRWAAARPCGPPARAAAASAGGRLRPALAPRPRGQRGARQPGRGGAGAALACGPAARRLRAPVRAPGTGASRRPAQGEAGRYQRVGGENRKGGGLWIFFFLFSFVVVLCSVPRLENKALILEKSPPPSARSSESFCRLFGRGRRTLGLAVNSSSELAFQLFSLFFFKNPTTWWRTCASVVAQWTSADRYNLSSQIQGWKFFLIKRCRREYLSLSRNL